MRGDLYDYDAVADTIAVDDITSCNYNAEILRRLKDNDPNFTHVRICGDRRGSGVNSYHISYVLNLSPVQKKTKELCTSMLEHGSCCFGDNCIYAHCCADQYPKRELTCELGWLGYFIGKNTALQKLSVVNLPKLTPSDDPYENDMATFLSGIGHNKSIQSVHLENIVMGNLCNVSPRENTLVLLDSFLDSNGNITELVLADCFLGNGGCLLLSDALMSCASELKSISLIWSDLGDGNAVDLIAALNMHPQLEQITVDNTIRMGMKDIRAMATLLQWTTTELHTLHLKSAGIDDEGIAVLVPALINCVSIRNLDLSENPLITTRGWWALSSSLESPRCILEELHLTGCNVDDEALDIFADALSDNCRLKSLTFNSNVITTEGWAAISQLLCDTSSINKTFSSNHTLQVLGFGLPNSASSHLILNRNADKKLVAMTKILNNHRDFDMKPFFEWEFKVLPTILHWLDMAAAHRVRSNANIEQRKLSAIYQYIRGTDVVH